MIKNIKFRYIFILKSRNSWAEVSPLFNLDLDLILTYDTALLKKVVELGGKALYIDHLEDPDVMQKNNFLAYQFFKSWHLSVHGKDIFTYRNVPFGFSFRLEIWNDFISYIRHRICLGKITGLKFDRIFVESELDLVKKILIEMGISFFLISSDSNLNYPSYFFKIDKWIDEKIRIRKFKHKFRDFITRFQSLAIFFIAKAINSDKKNAVFIQEYYPTTDLVKALQKDSKLKVVLAHFSWSKNLLKYFFERPIPIFGDKRKFEGDAQYLISKFRRERCTKLFLSQGQDVTEAVYKIIDDRISDRISESLLVLDSVIEYLDKNPINLAILIANIGQISTMVDCVCRVRSIPSYLIINGIMSGDFLDESKYATFINSYSRSMKEHYYKGMNNVVALGDPRMDLYINKYKPRVIYKKGPTITIGTSAHSIIDLNSYLAVEFDFMYDVLTVLNTVKKQDPTIKIIIKVRSNGYLKQYQDFINEFFPNIVDEMVDSAPFHKVLEKTDFYISLYSQTLFEASCLGIPCLYYKNDCEIIDPPFDGSSELVTVNNPDDLLKAVNDFLLGSDRYNLFMKKDVMEKYIGFLDGKNLQRNINYVYDLLKIEVN
jgi:hypothetical protein